MSVSFSVEKPNFDLTFVISESHVISSINDSMGTLVILLRAGFCPEMY